MSLTSLLLTGSTAVLTLIKQYFANPSVAGVSIECTQYTPSMQADVSQKMIVDVNQGKQYITDNIAPRPREWRMEGYLAPAFYEISSLSPILQPSLKFQQDTLQTAFYSRQLVIFKTKNGEETLSVGIVDLSFPADPSITNRIPVSITVREVNVLYAQITTGNIGVPGGYTNVASAATASGTTVANPDSLLFQLFNARLLSPFGVGF